jgi:cell division protein FtsI/penicillin-binding protein 2
VRLKALVVIIFLAFTLIALRLFHLQIITGREFMAAAEKQHFAEIILPSQRGKILASDGTSLVTSEITYLVFANAKKITVSPDEIIKKVGTVSGDLTNSQAYWVPLKSKVSKAEKDRIISLGFEGIDYAPEPARFYPEASAAAHLLGFVGSDINGQPKGYFGVEGYYDRELAGRSGFKRIEKDAFGRPLVLSPVAELPANDGRDIVISVDKTVQLIVQKYLKDGIRTWGATGGTAIVMNPVNGRILAMDSYPAYDPGNYEKFGNEVFKNPAVTETFEPGSIMKPLIMAAAINENKLEPQTRCPVCSGPRSIGGGVIKTFNEQYHPGATMIEVLINSDNTGMVYVGEILGKDLLLKYLSKFRFGEKTGVDLQEEESGKVKKEWYPLDLATVTFGQGIAVTSLQMVRAFAAIANGGFMVTPQVATKIGDFEVKPHINEQILSAKTAQVIKEMMVQVNLKSPLHFPFERTANLSRYRVAAKSGTAQIPISGKYTDDKTIASVIGFAPADDPKFVVYVKLNEPNVRIWGSDTAGPVFYNIIRDLLLYYNVAP